MRQRLLWVDGLLQTKFKIHDIARQNDLFEVRMDYVHGCQHALGRNIPFEFSESIEITINSD